MKSYRVWCPERGETEAQARVVEARSAGVACSKACESSYWKPGDTWDEIELHVRLPNGAGRAYTVDVEVLTEFFASRAKAEVAPALPVLEGKVWS